MSYEIWDRYNEAFVESFDSELEAMAYLRDMVKSLTPEAAILRIDRMRAGRANGGIWESVSLLGRLPPRDVHAPKVWLG